MLVVRDYPIGPHSRWRVGGHLRFMAFPASVDDVRAAMQLADANGLPWLPIGDTSNLLVADGEIRAFGICLRRHMHSIVVQDSKVIAEAGAWVPWLARHCANAGLAGLTHVAGIPGTVGGLVAMNGGSQRHSIGENVIWVDCVTESGSDERIVGADCGFSYRQSRFQSERVVITAVSLHLNPDAKRGLRAEMLLLLRERRRKFPLRQPNCGSVFRSDPRIYREFGPPGKVIEQLGLKGLRIGGALVSNQHANFIVNTGGARASDILQLIHRVQSVVSDATGLLLQTEVKWLTTEGEVRDIPKFASTRGPIEEK